MHRLLQDIEDEGMAERTPAGEWELSFRLLEIAGLQLERIELPTLCRPFAERMAEATRETVTINALSGLHGVCIDKVRGNDGMQLDMRIGARGFLYCGGAGKVMLADMTKAEQQQVLDGPFTALTPKTIIDPAVLGAELGHIRARGFAIDDQEVLGGGYCVAVAILDGNGRPVGANRGRVPIIINTGAAGTDLAISYSRAAEAAGADALMVIPPSFMPASADEILDHYVAIDRAAGLPIILQEVPQGPIPPGLAVRIADACRNVRYIKVETLPVASKESAIADLAGARLTIFGGAGGSYFIEELRRGALGTMPFCSQPADFVAVWNAFRAGDERLAQQRFDSTIMAINRLAAQGGDIFHAPHKQLLVRRGAIRTAFVGSPTTTIDPVTVGEIADLLAQAVPVARRFRSFAA